MWTRSTALAVPVVVILACFWLPLTGADWRDGSPYGDQESLVVRTWLFLLYAAPAACLAAFVVGVALRRTRGLSAWWLLGTVIGFVAEVASLGVITQGFSS